MDMMPAAIAMQMAMVQQSVALSALKRSFETQQQVADMLMATIDASRGGNVNLFA